MGPQQKPQRGCVGGSRPAPPAGGRENSLPCQERATAGTLPRGQALQGKQKSVVNTVPNPKWLLPNCNPIKVRLVYLSSLGLFITVQMAATFGRLSSSLPAARHAKLSSTESGPAPVRGHARRQPAGRVLCPPSVLPVPPLCAADGAGSTLPAPLCQQQGSTPGVAPLITPVAGAPGKERTAARSPLGSGGDSGGCLQTRHPTPSARQLETRGPVGHCRRFRLEEKGCEDQGQDVKKRQ